MWKFLQNEMLVILGLTEDAERTDAEIADVFDMKKGTVSSARRRLLDAGAIHFAYVPAFNRLGCELIGFHMGATDPAVRSEVKANHHMEFCNRSPEVFFSVIGGSSVVFFTALRNATEFESFVQRHNAFFTGSRRVSRSKLMSTVFPYALSRLTPVPQFAPLVHTYFGLDVPRPRTVPIAPVKVDPVELTENEKKALVAMVKNPDASDRVIASSIRTSRQAVTRMRNKFRDEGLLTKICVPRLYRWGFEIFAVAHPKFTLDISWDKRIKTQPRNVVELSFYTLSKADEGVANYMVSKFTEYSEQLENILAWYHRVGVFDEKPEITLFSLERSTELRAFDFYPAVKNLLLPEDPPGGDRQAENL